MAKTETVTNKDVLHDLNNFKAILSYRLLSEQLTKKQYERGLEIIEEFKELMGLK